jgi:hypothetical protein
MRLERMGHLRVGPAPGEIFVTFWRCFYAQLRMYRLVTSQGSQYFYLLIVTSSTEIIIVRKQKHTKLVHNKQKRQSLLIKLTMTMALLATLNNKPQNWQCESNWYNYSYYCIKFHYCRLLPCISFLGFGWKLPTMAMVALVTAIGCLKKILLGWNYTHKKPELSGHLVAKQKDTGLWSSHFRVPAWFVLTKQCVDMLLPLCSGLFSGIASLVSL